MGRDESGVLGFDDLRVGDQWQSPGRTIGRTEVSIFAGLTGDFNPLHVDHAWAASGPFGRPVAHGLLGLAIASGLASTCPRVATLALVRMHDWSFLHPIHLDDTLSVISRVESLEPTSRGRRGRVVWVRRLLNQDRKIVQEGRVETLVDGRPRGPSDPTPAPDQ